MTRRRGFTLLELMFAIGLIAFLSLVGVRLLRATLRTWHDSAAAQAEQSRFDHAIGLLRRDVWVASSIEAPKPGTAILQTPGGRIEWDADPNGDLLRRNANPSDALRWEAFVPVTFTARDGDLILHVSDRGGPQGHAPPEEQIVFTSQAIRLAEGSK